MAVHPHAFGQSLMALHTQVQQHGKQAADVAQKQRFGDIMARQAPATQVDKVHADTSTFSLHARVSRRRGVAAVHVDANAAHDVAETSLGHGGWTASQLHKTQNAVMMSLAGKMGTKEKSDDDEE